MARAFVLEPTKVPVEQASRHGTVTFVFNHGDQRPSIWDDAFINATMNRLKKNGFDPVRDLFVVAGHMVTITLIVSAMLREYRRVRVLLYSSTERDYFPRTLEV